MKTPVEIFESWLLEVEKQKLLQNPKRFHPIPAEISSPFDDQRKIFAHRMNQIRGLFYRDRIIDIHIDFIANDTCNAVADIWEGMGIVAMTKGGILLPLEMFYRMFSHPLILPGLGKSYLEQVGPQHGEGITDDYGELVRLRIAAGRSHLPTLPLDPVRRSVAVMCMDLMWGFLIMHELIHILHGHVGYLQNRATNAIPFMLEASKTHRSTVQQADIDLQTLELWADEKAVAVVLRGLLKNSDDEYLLGLFPTLQHKLFIWSFSMFTFFRIWDLTIDPSDLSGTHPPTALRFSMAMHAAHDDVLASFPSISDKQFWDAVHQGQRAADGGIVHCGGMPLLTKDVIGTFDPLTRSHLARLGDHFNNFLAKELERYSLVPIDRSALPPQPQLQMQP